VQTTAKPYPAFTPVSYGNPLTMAGFHTPAKTNNALIYSIAMLEASIMAAITLCMVDNQGHICETASGNIFWITGGTLITPAPLCRLCAEP